MEKIILNTLWCVLLFCGSMYGTRMYLICTLTFYLNLVQHTVERTTPPVRRIELGAQSMPMLVGGSRPLVQGCFLVKEKEIFFFFVYLFQQTLEGSRSQNLHQSRVVGSQSELLTKSCHGLFFLKTRIKTQTEKPQICSNMF